MYFAHVVGEHQIDSPTSLEIHILLSWIAVLAAPLIIAGATYLLLKYHRKQVKQEVRK